MLALKWHPDKNSSANALSRFQEIQEAYEYLCKNVPNKSVDYKTLLSDFFTQIFEEDSENRLIAILASRIFKMCNEDNLLLFLNRINHGILTKIHIVIKKYQDILHLTDSFLRKIESILENKCDIEGKRILLHPFIEDMMDGNLYKLLIDGETYIVPLWHQELVFETPEKRSICVDCFPVLPDNISIDISNNIHCNISVSLLDLWKSPELKMVIGGKTICIKKENLQMIDFQKITVLNEGVPLINTKDIFNITKRGDIYIYLTIHSN